jgi:hypothetical protein
MLNNIGPGMSQYGDKLYRDMSAVVPFPQGKQAFVGDNSADELALSRRTLLPHHVMMDVDR